MDKKPVMVEINDLREFVGGTSDVTVGEQTKIGHSEAAYPVNGTSMCYYIGPSPDAADDWIVIKGK